MGWGVTNWLYSSLIFHVFRVGRLLNIITLIFVCGWHLSDMDVFYDPTDYVVKTGMSLTLKLTNHHSDVIRGAIASQITSPTIVNSAVYSDTDQRKHKSSASLAFVTGGFSTQRASNAKMFPIDDVIMRNLSNPIFGPYCLWTLQKNIHLICACASLGMP